MGTLSNWQSYFGATRRPNFGDVHTKYGQPDFEKEYLWSSQLQEFRDQIFDTLTGNFEILNMLITGNPGVGKTSFLYSLRHELEVKQQSNYIIKIFHSNRARGFTDPVEVESRIQEEILDAWKIFFEQTNNASTFDQIVSNGSDSIKKKINDVSDFYIKNKSKFGKILIFSVDDVDLLSQEELKQIVRFVISNLEVKSVKKFFMVRPQTYENYDADTKKFLQGFFPDIRHLPRTPLYDLVRHRINAAKSEISEARVPFSTQLCKHVEDFVDGNLRQALPILEKILSQIEPPARPSTSQEFTANHIDRIAIRVLLTERVIPNLHSFDYRVNQFPIATDVLTFLIQSPDIAVIKAATDDAIKMRYETASQRKAGRSKTQDNRTPYLRDADLLVVIEKLTRAQLIEKLAGSFRLTKFGRVVARFANRPYFLTESMRISAEEEEEHGDMYQRHAEIAINHEEIIDAYLRRGF